MGNYVCVPVIVKPFVAPLKRKTIPRLELLGCLTLVRLYESCCKALDFVNLRNCKRVFWVDSQTVLSWIRIPPREFRPFVSVRVAKIQETVGVEHFRCVRSKSNVVDVVTRGVKVDQLASWMIGPPFFKLPEEEWPKFQEDLESIQLEAKNEVKHSSNLKLLIE